ncbi:hypothetical protein CDAR_606161 [Caerostris darwini]|uniref:Uncharacterized protein n=1 Tax=Caerostris darwini TaxID=1538125 RepID=A0AAV4NQ39_9ARAC|nr:hypothetical protein CDAR_606161 [Caerostris darwini]
MPEDCTIGRQACLGRTEHLLPNTVEYTGSFFYFNSSADESFAYETHFGLHRIMIQGSFEGFPQKEIKAPKIRTASKNSWCPLMHLTFAVASSSKFRTHSRKMVKGTTFTKQTPTKPTRTFIAVRCCDSCIYHHGGSTQPTNVHWVD